MKNSPTHLFTIAALLISSCVYSQNRISVMGRYGINTNGITAAIPISPNGSIEGMYTMSHDKVRRLFTALYEERYAIGNNTNFEWFAGVGLHAGYNRMENIVAVPSEPKYDRLTETVNTSVIERKFVSGADAVLGITYRVPGIPLTIGIDMKPNVDFVNKGSMMVDGGVRAGFSF